MMRLVPPVDSIPDAMRELQNLCARINIEVKYGRSGDYDHISETKGIITLTRTKRGSRAFFEFLHELGHALADRSYSKEIYKRMTYERRKDYWTFEDECQANRFADDILYQLNPKFYNEKYIRDKQESLRTYYS